MVASKSKASKPAAAPSRASRAPEAGSPRPGGAGRAADAGNPRPGRAVRGSTTGRPIMALLDLLGRRWALRVLWELRAGESLTFRELQARCAEVSSSVLNYRLRELRAAGVVTAEAGRGYSLTREGLRLLDDLAPLDGWAKRWARRTGRTPAASGPPAEA